MRLDVNFSTLKIEVDGEIRIVQDVAPAWIEPLQSSMGRLESSMSTANEKLDKIEAGQVKIAASVDGLVADHETMAAEIQSLKDALVTAGNLSPELEARFDRVIANNDDFANKLDALDKLTPPPGGDQPPADGGSTG